MQKLLFVLAVLFVATGCKKDRHNDPVTPPVTDTVLTDVYFYSSTDTTSGEYVRHDHIFYNKDKRIDSMVSDFPEDPQDAVISTFAYNSDGNLQQLRAWAPASSPEFFRDYTIGYDAGKRVTSLDYRISTYGLGFTFAYDGSGRLQHYSGVYNYDVSNNTNPDFVRVGDPYTAGTFFRSSGRLDSIYSDNAMVIINGDTSFNRSVIVLNGATALPANAIDRAYLLALTWSRPRRFPMDGNFSIFLHQFLDPSVSYFRSGSYGTTFPGLPEAEFTGKPIDFTAVLNADKRVRWITNSLEDLYQGWSMMKLEYTKLD